MLEQNLVVRLYFEPCRCSRCCVLPHTLAVINPDESGPNSDWDGKGFIPSAEDQTRDLVEAIDVSWKKVPSLLVLTTHALKPVSRRNQPNHS